jgi:hypothetical protein
MPKIVQSRLLATRVGSSNTNVFAQSLEYSLQSTFVNCLPLSVDEEMIPGAGRWMSRRSPTGVIAQDLCQLTADGNQTRLEKLAVPDGKQPVW